jgi:hypothetical protein
LKEWQQPHTYLDGTVDLPYLDGSVFKEQKEKEKEEKNESP